MFNMTTSPLKLGEIVTYFLKVPNGKRKSFSIVKRISNSESNPKYDTFENEQIKIINGLFLAGKKSFESTRKEFKQVIHELATNEKKRRGDLISCDENNILMKEYLNKKYPIKRRKEMDFKSVENETSRSLKLLGTKSLLSMTTEEIQDCIDTLEPSLQKRYVSRLHSILRTLGRNDIELFYSKPRKNRVTHLEIKDLHFLINQIKKESKPIAGITSLEFADFISALFCTGMRIGEAIGIESHDFNKTKCYIRVRQQLKQDGSISETKNKKERKSIIIKSGIKEVENWILLDKTHFNRYQAAKYLSKKTKEIFKDKNKQISLHGLRHSYAIHLLRVVEASISTVALFLGDSIKTTEDYYIDFVASDETIDSVLKKMK
jgi:integrase